MTSARFSFPVPWLLFACSAALALGFSACAETTRNFNNTGGAGTGGAGGSGTGGQGGSGQGGQGGQVGQGGQGGGLPTACTPGMPPYAGPLCGSPDGGACAVLTSELVSANPSFRNDAPGVALDDLCAPQVVFSEAVGGFKGFYATRLGQDNWMVEQTPFAIATGGNAVGKNGESYALVDNGAFGVTLFRRDAGGWDGGHAIMGKHHAAARGLARDENGFLHAGVRTDTEDTEYAFFDINSLSWSINPLGVKSSARVAAAVTPGGNAHFAYWAVVASTWVLHWRSPPQAAEQAMSLNSNGLGIESQMHAITVLPATPSNPTGVPHIAAVRVVPGNPQQLELAYITREAVNNWPVTVIDSPQTLPGDTCSNGPWPTQPGLKCNYDYEEIRPLGIVAAQSGHVRLLYNKIHRMGTRVSDCFMPMDCYWKDDTDSSEGAIVVAAVGKNQMAASASLGKDVFFSNATVTLDRIGRIHIAGYDAQPGAPGTTVRYIVIGPMP